MTWLLLAFTLMTETTVTVRVWPPNFQFEPGFLRITATVPKHASNRLLDLITDSASGFYRRTQIQLDGEGAPLSHQVEYRDVPAGDYVIMATVLDSRRESRGMAIRETRVLSRHVD